MMKKYYRPIINALIFFTLIWFLSPIVASWRRVIDNDTRRRAQLAMCSKLVGQEKDTNTSSWVEQMKNKIHSDPSNLTKLLKVSDGPFLLQELPYDEAKMLIDTCGWEKYFVNSQSYSVYTIGSNLVNSHPVAVDQFYIIIEGEKLIDLNRIPLVPW